MYINSTACLLLLSFLTKNACCREAQNFPIRAERRELQEYFDDAMDPNFWPVRGRREDKEYEKLISPYSSAGFNLGKVEGPYPLMRNGRNPKEEETGVFWAGRGRSLVLKDFLTSEDNSIKSWPHKGKENEYFQPVPIPIGESTTKDSIKEEDMQHDNRLVAEEPGWIWLAVNEVQPTKNSKVPPEDVLFCSTSGKGTRNEKFEIRRQKFCHLKRKSNNFLRELPQAEQFWPLRGKKLAEPTSLRNKKPLPYATAREISLLEDNTFWPVRGRRTETSLPESLHYLKTFWPSRGRRNPDAGKEDPHRMKSI